MDPELFERLGEFLLPVVREEPYAQLVWAFLFLKEKPMAKQTAKADAPAVKKAVGSVKRKTDWEAIERDYRTGKFTLRELETKYGVSYAQISRKSTAEKWTKDLRTVIKQATDAALLQETVTKAQKSVTETVSAAVELNKQVILKHRTLIAELSENMLTAKAKLMSMGDMASDIREAATFVQAIGNLTGAAKTLMEQERKAFGLDDEDDSKSSTEDKFLAAIKARDAELGRDT